MLCLSNSNYRTPDPINFFLICDLQKTKNQITFICTINRFSLSKTITLHKNKYNIQEYLLLKYLKRERITKKSKGPQENYRAHENLGS